jgi:hypothetical protein
MLSNSGEQQVRVTVCGPETESSAIVRSPAEDTWVVESAVTVTVHDDCGASETPQSLVWVKAGWPEVGSLLMVMLSIVTAVVLGLFNMAVLGVPGAVNTIGPGVVSCVAPPLASSPSPVMRIGISGFAEVLIRGRYALRVPMTVGLKTNSKLHDVPGITGVEQVPPPGGKSSGFVPENED